jgi:hypothetical protein
MHPVLYIIFHTYISNLNLGLKKKTSRREFENLCVAVVPFKKMCAARQAQTELNGQKGHIFLKGTVLWLL